MIRSFVVSSVVAASLLAVACGGTDDVTVGKSNSTDQKLQTQADGSPTGNGTSCSWAGTTTYADAYGTSTTVKVPTYSVGDEFKSIDGCNTCTCAAQGIECTLLACADAGPKACPALARICNDGSSPTPGPDCRQICPEDGISVACTEDARKCPDGSYVGRTAPSCDFAPCGSGPVACPALAKQCPDGSYVGPTGPNCAFPECPTGQDATTCSDLMTSASNAIPAAIARDSACKTDSDCEPVPSGTSCSAGCSVVIAATGVSDFNATIAKLEGTTCADFKSRTNPACSFAAAACPAHVIFPRCNAGKCGE